jgi:S-adenosyl methyltransferase
VDGRALQPDRPEARAAQLTPGSPNTGPLARIYNYWLGGKDNFAVDREAAEQVMRSYSAILPGVRANRAFLGRAVRYLAAEGGIRRFLDIGTGIPSADNTHEVAQAAAPDSRVVYVDNDPIVLAHARALLTSVTGTTAYLDADVRDPATILAGAAATLDFGQPIAVMLIAIMHCVPDEDDPYAIVRQLMAAVPPGSYLVLSQPAKDMGPDAGVAPRRAGRPERADNRDVGRRRPQALSPAWIAA